MALLNLRSFPRAIIHIDGDSFFASCEQALHPELRGKPVVTGKERGIASAVSIEAKKLGIKRAMSIRDIQHMCPEVIHLPSDYESYSLFSKRMFEIVRRYTSVVEEYSIDECFAEITGLRRPLRMNYQQIAKKIKDDLENELGMTFSVGLAPTKVVAKIASKWNKPSGLTIIPANKLHLFLEKVPIGDVWGIGNQTTAHMHTHGIRTALDFASKDRTWVETKFTKPHQEIWQELKGNSILTLETKEKHDYKSISKTKTFTPPSRDRDFVFSQLSKNIENACIKARRHGLASKRVLFFLKTQEYKHCGYEFKLSHPTALPGEILSIIDEHFDEVFNPKQYYRSTGVVLSELWVSSNKQMDLFGDLLQAEKISTIYGHIDMLSKKYGKHTVFLGSSFRAMTEKQFSGERSQSTERVKNLFKGETRRKRLGIPLLGDVT